MNQAIQYRQEIEMWKTHWNRFQKEVNKFIRKNNANSITMCEKCRGLVYVTAILQGDSNEMVNLNNYLRSKF